MIGHTRLAMLGFLLIIGGLAVLFTSMPSGFLPDEDQALLFGQVSLPPGATAEQDERRQPPGYRLHPAVQRS